MPPERTARHEHSPARKNRFIGRVLAHQKIEEAADAENIPLDTAKKILHKFRETGTAASLPRAGRPKKIDTRGERNIVRNAVTSRRKVLNDISNETAHHPSVTTVRRILQKHGYRRCVAMKKPYLSLEHRDGRFGWADYRRDFGEIDFESTIFSDECYVHVGDKSGRVYVTRRPDEKMLEECVVPTFKQSPLRVMVWGCIIKGTKGPLVVLEYPGGKGGGMTAARYQEQVLDGALRTFFAEMKKEKGLVDFQQDGAPAHKAKSTLRWFKRAHIPLAEHPAQSPDLSPIEPCWNDLKHIIRSGRSPTTLDGLKAAVIAAWDAIPQETIDRHINSMPDRIQALLHAKGGHIDY